jgi:hypothetical protein
MLPYGAEGQQPGLSGLGVPSFRYDLSTGSQNRYSQGFPAADELDLGNVATELEASSHG